MSLYFVGQNNMQPTRKYPWRNKHPKITEQMDKGAGNEK